MPTSHKKILIAAIIFFVIAISIGLYFYFFVLTKNENTLDDPNGGNPFGTAGNTTYIPSDRITNPDGSITIPVIALTHIYPDPIAGATSYKSIGNEYTRFVDRATGHTYSFDFSSGLLQKTTNTTIPKIYESAWAAGGEQVLLRYLTEDENTITTYSGTLILPPASSTEVTGTIQGTFLPDNITSIAVQPSNKKVAYVATSNVGSKVVTSNIDGTKSTTLYSSALSRWQIAWPNDATLTLTSSPSSQNKGYLYLMNASTGALRKVLGNINGLTAVVDPTANLIAYSDNSNMLSVYNIKDAVTKTLPIDTLAEKCVWSKKEKGILYCAVPQDNYTASMPDQWYQGATSFDDNIYRIDTTLGTAAILADLAGTFKQSIDAINPVLSPDENYMVFMNKKDLSLWSLRISI